VCNSVAKATAQTVGCPFAEDAMPGAQVPRCGALRRAEVEARALFPHSANGAISDVCGCRCARPLYRVRVWEQLRLSVIHISPYPSRTIPPSPPPRPPARICLRGFAIHGAFVSRMRSGAAQVLFVARVARVVLMAGASPAISRPPVRADGGRFAVLLPCVACFCLAVWGCRAFQLLRSWRQQLVTLYLRLSALEGLRERQDLDTLRECAKSLRSGSSAPIGRSLPRYNAEVDPLCERKPAMSRSACKYLISHVAMSMFSILTYSNNQVIADAMARVFC
jgi:hypothetical protein